MWKFRSDPNWKIEKLFSGLYRWPVKEFFDFKIERAISVGLSVFKNVSGADLNPLYSTKKY